MRYRLGVAKYSLERWARFALILITFAVIYGFSLTPVYVEGDDARTIVFHALGRQPEIQPQYAVYHSMFDQVLGLLPADEPMLRIFAYAISALAAVLFPWLILLLSDDLLPVPSLSEKLVLTVGLLMISPELFFMGLIINPAILGMSLILIAHLLARKIYDDQSWGSRAFWWLFSILLFSIGTGFRWPLLPYGLVVVADMTRITRRAPSSINRNMNGFLALLWGVSALVGTFVVIFPALKFSTSDQSALDFIVIWLSQQKITTLTLIRIESLITPAFGLALLAGVFWVLGKRRDWSLPILASVLPTLPLALSGTVKFLLPAVPGLAWLALAGMRQVMGWTGRRSIAKFGWLVIIVIPWILGFKIVSPDTLWGPGFEMTIPALDASTTPPVFTQSTFGRNLGIHGMSVVLWDGLAFPTSEGPRALGGYAGVLLGGKWRNFVTARDQELSKVLDVAILDDLPILVISARERVFVKLLERSFVLDEQMSSDDRFVFTRSNRVVNVYVDGSTYLQDPNTAFPLNSDRAVIVSDYSSILLDLKRIAGSKFEWVGPFVGVLTHSEP